MVEADYAMLPGYVASASTYEFPVLNKVLKDVTFERIAVADLDVPDVLITGGQALIAAGVRAVVSENWTSTHFKKCSAQQA